MHFHHKSRTLLAASNGLATPYSFTRPVRRLLKNHNIWQGLSEGVGATRSPSSLLETSRRVHQQTGCASASRAAHSSHLGANRTHTCGTFRSLAAERNASGAIKSPSPSPTLNTRIFPKAFALPRLTQPARPSTHPGAACQFQDDWTWATKCHQQHPRPFHPREFRRESHDRRAKRAPFSLVSAHLPHN